MSTYNVVASTNESTVVAEYRATYDQHASYQFNAMINRIVTLSNEIRSSILQIISKLEVLP